MSLFGKLFRSAAAVALVGLGTESASAQYPVPEPTSISNLSTYWSQGEVNPAGFGHRLRGEPCCPPSPYYPCPPGTPMPGMPPVVEPPPPPPTTQIPPGPGILSDGAGPGDLRGVNGYIENAPPVSMARLRFDSAYGANRPDRAEFFYPKYRSTQARDANGLPITDTNVDYQELMLTGEAALFPRFSVFADLPFRFLNPTLNDNNAGLSDISFGAKFAVIANNRRVVSFFLRTIAPTGRAGEGLGTRNWWLEPGILFLEQMSPKWQIFGELRDQFPVDRQSDFTGNVLRYGLGTSYLVAQGCWGYVAPVAELVGWTVLSGQQLSQFQNTPLSASGNTIINAKLGVRVGFGQMSSCSSFASPYLTRSDLYVGYGRALTGAVWYEDLLRVEYRWFF